MNGIEILPPEKEGVGHFDYSTLSEGLAEEARQVAAKIKAGWGGTILHTGRQLKVMKEKLEHGRFHQWVAAEFGWNEKAVQRYLNAFEAFGSESDILSVLSVSAIYKLAAPSTPASIREEIVARAAAGERFAVAEVHEMVRAALGPRRTGKRLGQRPAATRSTPIERGSLVVSEVSLESDGTSPSDPVKSGASGSDRETAWREVAKFIVQRSGEHVSWLIERLRSLGDDRLASEIKAVSESPSPALRVSEPEGGVIEEASTLDNGAGDAG